MRRISSAVRRSFGAARWYVGELMGDHAYEHYVTHLRRNHPDAPVPTERQYWRDRHAAADANPGARCC